MTKEAPKGTGLLTLSGRLTRDSEISQPRFWGAEGTLTVPFGPYLFSVETEIAGRTAKSTQTLARTGHKRKTPGGRFSAPGVNWSVAVVRRKSKSSPKGTLFVTILSFLESASCLSRKALAEFETLSVAKPEGTLFERQLDCPRGNAITLARKARLTPTNCPSIPTFHHPAILATEMPD